MPLQKRKDSTQSCLIKKDFKVSKLINWMVLQFSLAIQNVTFLKVTSGYVCIHVLPVLILLLLLE